MAAFPAILIGASDLARIADPVGVVIGRRQDAPQSGTCRRLPR